MDKVFRKLRLGCFDQVYYGWVNKDVTPHIFLSRIPGIAFILFKVGILGRQRYEQYKQGVFNAVKYLNVTKKFPYADATFDCIFSSHLLEHLYPYQTIFCIKETFRVLRKGGVVGIGVPDLDKIVQNYDSKHPENFLEAIFESKQKYNKTNITGIIMRHL